MRARAVVALALLLLVCGKGPMPPPYVNPLRAEQLDRLRISEIRIEHLQDGSIDAEKAAKAAELVRAHLNEQLKDKLAPGAGNAVLVVQLRLVFLKENRLWLEWGRVQLLLAAKMVGPGISTEYSSGGGWQAVSPTNRGWEVAVPGEHLPPMARGAGERLARQILCCTIPALIKPPGDRVPVPPMTPPLGAPPPGNVGKK